MCFLQAAKAGNDTCFCLLLDKGADKDSMDENGETALAWVSFARLFQQRVYKFPVIS